MSALKFEEDESGPTKVAVGMYSKDKEYVDFDTSCECVGQASNVVCIGRREEGGRRGGWRAVIGMVSFRGVEEVEGIFTPSQSPPHSFTNPIFFILKEN